MTTTPSGLARARPTRAELSRARTRLAGLVVALGAAGWALLVALALNAESLGERLGDLGALAAPVVAAVGAALIVAMLPAGLVAGAAGYALGTPAGFAAAIVAATIGAVLAALISRLVGTPAARHALGVRVARSFAFADDRPLRTVVVARLVPGLPFNAASYVLGLTRIPLRDVGVGTALGFAPRCFAYVALGGSLRDLSSPEAQGAVAASVLLVVLVAVAPRLLVRGRRPAPRPEDNAHG